MFCPLVRHHLKAALSRMVSASRAVGGQGNTANRSLILCYHSVGRHEHGLTISPEALKSHLQFLREQGYQFLTMGELAARTAGPGGTPDTSVVITFDDGFEDNYTQALPVLLESKVRATFFVTSGLLTGDETVRGWFARRVWPDVSWMQPRQLREMRALGMEIGAHTHTHPNLARLSAEQARHELGHAREVLENAISAPVTVMAYPFGRAGIHHTAETRAITRECGYVAAGSTASRTLRRHEDAMQVPRFFVTSRDTCETIRQKMRGDIDWLGWYHELSPGWLKRMISPEENYA